MDEVSAPIEAAPRNCRFCLIKIIARRLKRGAYGVKTATDCWLFVQKDTEHQRIEELKHRFRAFFCDPWQSS